MRLFCFVLFLLISQLGICQSDKLDSIPKRHLLNTLNFNNLNSKETCVISLKINLDRDGNIYDTPIVDRFGTTTSDLILINQVIEIVKKEATFSTGVLEMETIVFKVNIKKSSA